MILVVNTIHAQKSWSLDDCIAYAIHHNLELKNFTYSQDENQETYRQSVRSLLPSIDADADYVKNFGRSPNPNTNVFENTEFISSDYGLNAEIDLFQGFQKMNTIKASKFLYKASNEETLHQKYMLAFRVMSAFYDIQFMEGLLAISKTQKEISQNNYDMVKRQIELGQMAKADLYQAESALITDKLSVTQSENNVTAAKLRLMQEMNLTEEASISIVTTPTKPIEEVHIEIKNEDSIYNKAKDFVPILKAQELRVEAAKKQLAAVKGNLYPSLTLFGRIRSRFVDNALIEGTDETVSFRTQLKDNTGQVVGLSLRVPISNGWSNRSRVKQQKIAKMRAENTYEIQKQEMYQLIQQLVQEGKALKTEYQQSYQRMEAQELTFEIAQKRYEKGLINAIELNQSKNLFATSQNENLQVQLRLKVNESTLDFYQGLPVFNIDKAQ